MSLLEQWFEFYEALGVQVVPLHGIVNGACRCKEGGGCKQPGKHPKYAWKGAGSKRPGTLDNVGVSTDRLVVLDFDTVPAFASMSADFPETFMVRTAKGMHVWFLADPERPKRSLVGWRPSVDVRARGGLIVAPPSRTVVADSEYTSVGGDRVLPAPDWLMDELPNWRPLDQRALRGTGTLTDTTSPHFRPIVDRMLGVIEGAQSGGRNLTLFKVSSRLYELYTGGYIGADVRDEVLVAAYRSGLGVDEIERTVRSGWPIGI